MKDRRTQGAMLLLVGATALWLGLTDAALAYVRGALRPPLVISGVVLLALGAAALYRRDPGGHGHGHGAPRSGWLLALPVLVLLLVAPPALGSYAASRQAQATQGGGPTGAFPPLPEPVGGAVALPVSEFVTRALYDKDRSLQGARVRLLGFVAPEEGGGYLLTRFNLFCCAADGQAYQLAVHGDRAQRRADQWLVVEGRWQPQPVFGEIAPSHVRPVLVADSVTPVQPPADRYEHNLYGI